MTTATPVTIRPVEPNAEAIKAVKDNLGEALSALDSKQWDPAYARLKADEHTPDAVFAFEPIEEEVIEEVAPEVVRLLAEALNRRLPWTWEPEHVSGR